MAKEKESPKSAVKKQPERKVIQVRATRLGYYGHMLRPIGTVFSFRQTEDEGCPPWCEKVDGQAKEEERLEESLSDESNASSSDEVI